MTQVKASARWAQDTCCYAYLHRPLSATSRLRASSFRHRPRPAAPKHAVHRRRNVANESSECCSIRGVVCCAAPRPAVEAFQQGLELAASNCRSASV